MAQISEAEMIDYAVGEVTRERALEIEHWAASDDELAAELFIMRQLVGELRPTSFEDVHASVLNDADVAKQLVEVATTWGAERLVSAPWECRLAVNEAFVRLFPRIDVSREKRLQFYRLAAREVQHYVHANAALFQDKVGTKVVAGDTTMTMTKADEIRATRQGLEQLVAINPVQAEVYALRMYAGREFSEITELLEIGDQERGRREFEIASAEVDVLGRKWAVEQGLIESVER